MPLSLVIATCTWTAVIPESREYIFARCANQEVHPTLIDRDYFIPEEIDLYHRAVENPEIHITGQFNDPNFGTTAADIIFKKMSWGWAFVTIYTDLHPD